jgi:pyruvate/2-oxoglutarate dehydrogenase complex dihydrolipoamide acyltransferase (E2) component
MPPVEILMPELGESVHEGTVSRWLKKVGEFVKEDEPIVEIMTDKVNTELPSPASGILSKILIPEGELVEVFKAMGVITPEGEKEELGDRGELGERDAKKSSVSASSPLSPTSPSSPKSPKSWFSPVVRSMAKSHGISDAALAGISGSCSAGRVTKKDVENYLASPQSPDSPPSPISSASQSTPLVGMRKMIADHMLKSSAVPTVSTIIEIDVTNMVRFREQNKEGFQTTYGVKLTYTPFFIKALADAISEFPLLNASLRDDNQVVMSQAVQMGVAVSLGAKGDEGLIVPVIRNCETKSIVDIARDLEAIAARARGNALKPDEVQGGTFTLTNPGSYGALFGTPMINAPQAAIGGAYAITKKPVIVDDMIAIRSMMYFVLTYDHRIIDGLLAGRFLHSVKKKIEDFSFFE